MEIEKIGKKQNKITLKDGTKLRTADVQEGGCARCAFLKEDCSPVPCSPGSRADGRSVIWVKKEPK